MKNNRENNWENTPRTTLLCCEKNFCVFHHTQKNCNLNIVLSSLAQLLKKKKNVPDTCVREMELEIEYLPTKSGTPEYIGHIAIILLRAKKKKKKRHSVKIRYLYMETHLSEMSKMYNKKKKLKPVYLHNNIK